MITEMESFETTEKSTEKNAFFMVNKLAAYFKVSKNESRYRIEEIMK
jgi:hypothetical protein